MFSLLLIIVIFTSVNCQDNYNACSGSNEYDPPSGITPESLIGRIINSGYVAGGRDIDPSNGIVFHKTIWDQNIAPEPFREFVSGNNCIDFTFISTSANYVQYIWDRAEDSTTTFASEYVNIGIDNILATDLSKVFSPTWNNSYTNYALPIISNSSIAQCNQAQTFKKVQEIGFYQLKEISSCQSYTNSFIQDLAILPNEYQGNREEYTSFVEKYGSYVVGHQISLGLVQYGIKYLPVGNSTQEETIYFAQVGASEIVNNSYPANECQDPQPYNVQMSGWESIPSQGLAEQVPNIGIKLKQLDQFVFKGLQFPIKDQSQQTSLNNQFTSELVNPLPCSGKPTSSPTSTPTTSDSSVLLTSPILLTLLLQLLC